MKDVLVTTDDGWIDATTYDDETGMVTGFSFHPSMVEEITIVDGEVVLKVNTNA